MTCPGSSHALFPKARSDYAFLGFVLETFHLKNHAVLFTPPRTLIQKIGELPIPLKKGIVPPLVYSGSARELINISFWPAATYQMLQAAEIRIHIFWAPDTRVREAP